MIVFNELNEKTIPIDVMIRRLQEAQLNGDNEIILNEKFLGYDTHWVLETVNIGKK